METEALKKFNALMKEAIENTDYDSDLDRQLREAGLDKAPEFEFLRDDYIPEKKGFGRIRNSRMLKIAGFVAAVIAVSSVMTIASHSDFVSASRFEMGNFFFSVRNGFFTSDTQFDKTESGRKLLIENEEQISIGKDYLGALRIPGYIPEGYSFSSLLITKNSRNENTAQFVYENALAEILIIKQENIIDSNLLPHVIDIEDDFYIGDARVFYMPGVITDYNTIFVHIGSETFYISAPLVLDELVNVFKMLE